jgi:putative phosphoesterase
MACLFHPDQYTHSQLFPANQEAEDQRMKVGVVSDTHLRSMTRDFQRIYDQYLSGVDMILHAGDIVSMDVVEFLEKDDFHGVYGNMDPLEMRAILPDRLVLDIGGYRVGLIHGWGSSEGLEERIRPVFRDVDVIVYGHSHKAVSHVKDGILFFNPGTATGYSASGAHSIGILEFGDTISGTIIPI